MVPFLEAHYNWKIGAEDQIHLECVIRDDIIIQWSPSSSCASARVGKVDGGLTYTLRPFT